MPDERQQFTDESDSEYKLAFEVHLKYFFACVEADDLSPVLIDEYQQKIAHQISIRKLDRVMIKRDVPLGTTPAELCGVIFKVRGWDLRTIKYAFVDVEAKNIKAYKLALLYARNLGIEAEVFSDMQAAEEWLLA